jgi:hypothetical protein
MRERDWISVGRRRGSRHDAALVDKAINRRVTYISVGWYCQEVPEVTNGPVACRGANWQSICEDESKHARQVQRSGRVHGPSIWRRHLFVESRVYGSSQRRHTVHERGPGSA